MVGLFCCRLDRRIRAYFAPNQDVSSLEAPEQVAVDHHEFFLRGRMPGAVRNTRLRARLGSYPTLVLVDQGDDNKIVEKGTVPYWDICHECHKGRRDEERSDSMRCRSGSRAISLAA